MRNETFHTTGDRATALRHHAGCGDAHDGAAKGHRGELCSAIDELIAFTPRHYASAAIEFIV